MAATKTLIECEQPLHSGSSSPTKVDIHSLTARSASGSMPKDLVYHEAGKAQDPFTPERRKETPTKSPFSTPRSRLSALFSPLHRSSGSKGSAGIDQTTPTKLAKDKAAQVLGIGNSGQSSRFSVIRDARVLEGETDSEDDDPEEWESCFSDTDDRLGA